LSDIKQKERQMKEEKKERALPQTTRERCKVQNWKILRVSRCLNITNMLVAHRLQIFRVYAEF